MKMTNQSGHRAIFCVKADDACDGETLRAVIEHYHRGGDGTSILYPAEGWPEEIDEENGRIVCETDPDGFLLSLWRLHGAFRRAANVEASAGALIAPRELTTATALTICEALRQEAMSKFGAGAFAVSVLTDTGTRATTCHKFEMEYWDGGVAYANPIDAMQQLLELVTEAFINPAELRDALERVRERYHTALREGMLNDILPLFDLAKSRGEKRAEQYAEQNELEPNEALDDLCGEYDLDGLFVDLGTTGMTLLEKFRMYKIVALIGELMAFDREEHQMKDVKTETPAPPSLDGQVGIFWVARDKLLLHTITLAEAEHYGDFLNHPSAHNDLWWDIYATRYRVDFDYFPRGRIVYHKERDVYLLYHDVCIQREAEELSIRFPEGKCVVALDEHYQCRRCNKSYVDWDVRD